MKFAFPRAFVAAIALASFAPLALASIAVPAGAGGAEAQQAAATVKQAAAELVNVASTRPGATATYVFHKPTPTYKPSPPDKEASSAIITSIAPTTSVATTAACVVGAWRSLDLTARSIRQHVLDQVLSHAATLCISLYLAASHPSPSTREQGTCTRPSAPSPPFSPHLYMASPFFSPSPTFLCLCLPSPAQLSADAFAVIEGEAPHHTSARCERLLGPRAAGRCRVGSSDELYRPETTSLLGGAGARLCLSNGMITTQHQARVWLQQDACLGMIREEEARRGAPYTVFARVRTDM